MTEYRLKTKLTESLDNVQDSGDVVFVTEAPTAGAGYDRGYGVHEYFFKLSEEPRVGDVVMFPGVSGYENVSYTASESSSHKVGAFTAVVTSEASLDSDTFIGVGIVPLNGPVKSGPTGKYMGIPADIIAGTPAIIIGHGGVILKSEDPENGNWPSYTL